jgi:hypothetical protein
LGVVAIVAVELRNVEGKDRANYAVGAVLAASIRAPASHTVPFEIEVAIQALAGAIDELEVIVGSTLSADISIRTVALVAERISAGETLRQDWIFHVVPSTHILTEFSTYVEVDVGRVTLPSLDEQN